MTKLLFVVALFQSVCVWPCKYRPAVPLLHCTMSLKYIVTAIYVCIFQSRLLLLLMPMLWRRNHMFWCWKFLPPACQRSEVNSVTHTVPASPLSFTFAVWVCGCGGMWGREDGCVLEGPQQPSVSIGRMWVS